MVWNPQAMFLNGFLTLHLATLYVLGTAAVMIMFGRQTSHGCALKMG